MRNIQGNSHCGEHITFTLCDRPRQSIVNRNRGGKVRQKRRAVGTVIKKRGTDQKTRAPRARQVPVDDEAERDKGQKRQREEVHYSRLTGRGGRGKQY